MATKHQNTGTATDLLDYSDYRDSAGYDYVDRFPSAAQEWVFGDWDAEKYIVKFANNFSKKHLFTFEKKKENIDVAAYHISQSPASRSDSENYGQAEHDLLTANIAYKLANRTAAARKCTCNHQYNQHAAAGGACSIGGCACTQFITSYGLARRTAGRPDVDPLAGMHANKNTCIVLNYIPKTEFESVVVGSICAHEKPPGWTRGQNLRKNVGDVVLLKWDFGPARRGVIIQAITGQLPNTWARLQGVYVSARKTATAVGWQTWEVYHLETNPPSNAPF